MKSFLALSSFLITITCSTSFGTTLYSMNKNEFIENFVNQTVTSIPTDNLNGQTINNTFSMFLDGRGNIWGKMARKPFNEPQMDMGVYNIKNDGTFFIKWEHWDHSKELCGHVFNTKNAFISIDCNGVFHTVFMKASKQQGNHCKK